MRILGIPTLFAFSRRHNQAGQALSTWLGATKEARWKSLAEVKFSYPAADGGVKRVYTVFNVSGNKYRLITVIDYPEQLVSVVEILTHAQYDRWNKS